MLTAMRWLLLVFYYKGFYAITSNISNILYRRLQRLIDDGEFFQTPYTYDGC